MSNLTDINNLQIWDRVKSTPPEHVKPPTTGTKGLSSISAYYVFEKATEVFGPIGSGWGYSILKDEYVDADPIHNKEGTEVISMKKHHIMNIMFWYKFDGQKCEFESIGSTEYVMTNKYGISSDGEASKKSLTDAIKKALSMLGFCADVYQGKFEDMGYVEEMTNIQNIDKASDKDAERARQAQELLKEVDTVIGQINEARSMSELEGLYKSLARKLKDKEPKLLIKLTKAKDAAKEKLESEE